jgi:hypothetical protein
LPPASLVLSCFLTLLLVSYICLPLFGYVGCKELRKLVSLNLKPHSHLVDSDLLEPVMNNHRLLPGDVAPSGGHSLHYCIFLYQGSMGCAIRFRCYEHQAVPLHPFPAEAMVTRCLCLRVVQTVTLKVTLTPRGQGSVAMLVTIATSSVRHVLLPWLQVTFFCHMTKNLRRTGSSKQKYKCYFNFFGKS